MKQTIKKIIKEVPHEKEICIYNIKRYLLHILEHQEDGADNRIARLTVIKLINEELEHL